MPVHGYTISSLTSLWRAKKNNWRLELHFLVSVTYIERVTFYGLVKINKTKFVCFFFHYICLSPSNPIN